MKDTFVTLKSDNTRTAISRTPIVKNLASKADDMPLPLIKEGISLEPDMIFGWKP
jgi:hypothetical protein